MQQPRLGLAHVNLAILCHHEPLARHQEGTVTAAEDASSWVGLPVHVLHKGVSKRKVSAGVSASRLQGYFSVKNWTKGSTPVKLQARPSETPNCKHTHLHRTACMSICTEHGAQHWHVSTHRNQLQHWWTHLTVTFVLIILSCCSASPAAATATSCLSGLLVKIISILSIRASRCLLAVLACRQSTQA